MNEHRFYKKYADESEKKSRSPEIRQGIAGLLGFLMGSENG